MQLNSQRHRRERDHRAIVNAFRNQGLLLLDGDISAEQFAFAAHQFLARVSSGLVVLQLDDLTGEVDQVNVPATAAEHPNWRRKYAKPIEEIAFDDALWRIAEILTALRGPVRTSRNVP